MLSQGTCLEWTNHANCLGEKRSVRPKMKAEREALSKATAAPQLLLLLCLLISSQSGKENVDLFFGHQICADLKECVGYTCYARESGWEVFGLNKCMAVKACSLPDFIGLRIGHVYSKVFFSIYEKCNTIFLLLVVN